ncbi:MAG: PAS domain S-box protein [Bacteroidales bacterium]
MAGLKINICFWHIDKSLANEIITILENGNYDPECCFCKDIRNLEARVESGELDLIMADFDLPDNLRKAIEDFHRKITFHIPLIYLVGEKNEHKAAETLTSGVWDYLLKSHLVKLVPTVYSSQKYGKVLKHSRKVENELEESELKYRSIFNAVQDGMILIDPQTFGIIDFNQSLPELFGLEDIRDKNRVISYLTESSGSYQKKDIQKIAGSLDKGSVSYLCLNKKQSGEDFWTENILSRFEIGDDFQFILVIRNIQEQKIMEESLQISREHFRNLAENSPDVIMRFDSGFRHLYVNHTAFEETGIPIENFMNKTHSEMGVFTDEIVEFWESAIEKVFRTGKKNTVEFDFPKEHEKISFEWRLFPEFDEEEHIDSVLAIARNITESKKAREAINKSERRLKLAVEATSLGYWDWNLESDKVFYSPIYYKMLGYEPDELPHELETWHILLHDDDMESTLSAVDKVIQNKEESFEIEFRLLCKDGSYKWICSRGRAVDVKEDGKARRLIGTHEDISERRRNEAIQKALINISNAVNTTKNLNELYEKIREYLGKIVDTTNCFLALYNEESNMLTMPFHRDEVDSFTKFPVGKTLTGYVVNIGKAQLIDAEKEKMLTDKGLIEPVGSPCISWLGVPLKTDNRIIGVFVVQSYNEDIIYTMEDVSILEFVSDQIALAIERKRDQDNVRESQEKQRRIFESSPDPIIVVDQKGIMTDYNTSLLAALHITNEPVIGQNIFHFIDRKNWRIALRSFKKTWEIGYIKNLEFTLHRADGTTMESEVSTGAIYNNEGEPESMMIIFKDISERKEAERNLREAKEKAEESDRLKTAFLSNMSHEIRTPMNAIVGFSDLLNDTNISHEERNEFIAQINLGADNLMHLIDDIIDISKIEAGQLMVNKDECTLDELVKEQIVMFRENMERLDKTHLNLRLNWKWPSKRLVLYTDPFRLKQIISNLLNNAVKFTEKGFIELGVEQQESFVRIYVKDSGIGVESEKHQFIFDRFRQGYSSNTKLYGGTGLGLAISKNLVELLGGNIGVTSTPDKGSEFWFTIPVEELKNMEPMVSERKVNLNNDWKGKKILVAEDDRSNFNLISEVLKDTNVEIIWARDGQETIRLFDEHSDSLSLILMDIRMPVMDGYMCTRIIKEKNPGMPVIAQTAYAMSGEKENSREAGCDDYISKPLHVNKLIDTLGSFLK